ncbi:MAG: rRNA pseudouridine synthase [Spirochaetaceae bacterium]|jgi:23S rRNA pseudouridine2605 synthase|nr:rRNA pseudouridine synthase [Spirochaetaceae bacterium]
MPNLSESLRLQTYIARAGAASRRAGEALILAGRVTVNGRVITALGEKVSRADEVKLDGRVLTLETRRRYLALNKPPGYLCTSRDPFGRPLARDLLPPGISERLYSVGRLDYYSSGLIFFTNQGEFAAKIGHPSSLLEKEYALETSGAISDQFIETFLAGAEIENEKYQAKQITRTGKKKLRIVLIEGKNREIRRVCSFFHLHPLVLRRLRIGPVSLGNLPEGESRNLTPQEVALLLSKPL